MLLKRSSPTCSHAPRALGVCRSSTALKMEMRVKRAGRFRVPPVEPLNRSKGQFLGDLHLSGAGPTFCARPPPACPSTGVGPSSRRLNPVRTIASGELLSRRGRAWHEQWFSTQNDTRPTNRCTTWTHRPVRASKSSTLIVRSPRQACRVVLVGVPARFSAKGPANWPICDQLCRLPQFRDALL